MVSSIVVLLAGAMVPMALACVSMRTISLVPSGWARYGHSKGYGELYSCLCDNGGDYSGTPVIVMGVPIISFLGVFLMFYASVVFSNYVGMLYGSY